MIRIKAVYDGSHEKPWSLRYSTTNQPVDDRRFATLHDAGLALCDLLETID